MKKLALPLATLVFLAPSLGMLSIGVLFSTASLACAPATALNVREIPSSLTATTRNGEPMTLGRTQLTHAATIITVGARTDGVGRAGVVIALMAALTESRLRMLANSSAYPSSTSFPHDGDGRDHESLGLFQMRAVSGWGSVAELMDPTYQARAFFGGPTGPNYPSPRGLLDIPRWRSLAPGAAAQAVEVSAYPDRYANFQSVAETIVTSLTGGSASVWAELDNDADTLLQSPVGCLPGLTAGEPQPFTGPNPGRLVDDPTSRGRVTERMAHLIAQTRTAFPDTGWSCWSPRPGTKSEHPLGRACDITFGNRIGQRAKGRSLEAGWAMAAWFQTHADALGVQYLIWQGKAWTRARASAGWRPYNGGGMHNPASITGGHFDHLHVTVRA